MHKITSFVLAETARVKKTEKELSNPLILKSAPHYFGKSVPVQFILGKEKVNLGGKEVEFILKKYNPDTILVEATIEVPDVFADKILDLKEELRQACYQLAKKNGAKDGPSEEYTVYQISGYKNDPENFLETHGDKIAGLLKSEKLQLDEKEVGYTLSFNFKYAKDDLIIVDWDGAFIFDPEGEVGENIELLELANYQLLRYRVLDEDLDGRMSIVAKLTNIYEKKIRIFPDKEITKGFKEMIKIRSQSIVQFEALEKSIKLIGDWYSARLFELVSKKFRLDIWKLTIKDKLESLEDSYTMVSENLGISRIQSMEFIAQMGWLILIVLELWSIAQ